MPTVNLDPTIPQKLLKKIKKKYNGRDLNAVSYSDLTNISSFSKKKAKINEDILQLFPDLTLGMRIIISSILSPAGGVRPNLTYKFKDIPLPADIALKLSETFRTYFKKNYKITEKLSEILEDTMFTKGAYSEVIIPGSMLSQLASKIEVSTESGRYDIKSYVDAFTTTKYISRKKKKLLGNKIVLSDNLQLLKAEESYVDFIKNKELKLATESAGTVVKANNPFTKTEEILSIFSNGDEELRPFVKKLPPESVIPIHSKTDPSKHYGYFVLLDEFGRPMEYDNVKTAAELFKGNFQDESIEERIMKRAKKLLKSIDEKAPDLSNVEEIKNYIVAQTLELSLKETLIGDLGTVDIDSRKDLIDLVFHTLLADDKKIRILYVPESLMIYYMYEVRENGTGKTILEDISVLASIRAMILFVTLLSYIKSSIPTTEVDVELDETDPDPEKTIEKIMVEVMKNRQFTLPIGIIKVDDIVSWTTRLGYAFNFKHPSLPAMEINIEEKDHKIEPIDSDLPEYIDTQIWNRLGLTKEMIDNSQSPDFATTILINNELFLKRVLDDQAVFNPQITNAIKKLARVDGVLAREVKAVLTTNIRHIRAYLKKAINDENKLSNLEKLKDDDLVDVLYEAIIASLEVTLPEPELKDDNSLMEHYDKYSEAIDKVLDEIFDSSALPDELTGQLGDKLDAIKSAVKLVLKFRWISENGFVGDIADLLTMDENGKLVINVLEEYKHIVEAIQNIALPFLKDMMKVKDKIDREIDKLENEEEDEEDNTNDEEEEISEEEENSDEEEETGEKESSEEEEEEGSEETNEEEENEEEDNLEKNKEE